MKNLMKRMMMQEDITKNNMKIIQEYIMSDDNVRKIDFEFNPDISGEDLYINFFDGKITKSGYFIKAEREDDMYCNWVSLDKDDIDELIDYLELVKEQMN